jgi:hypothetical protein
MILKFLTRHFAPTNTDRKFIERHLDKNKDPFSYFYLLAKVHKTPWSTRPIISVSGSLLEGIGKWVDHQLKIVCKDLPYIIKSSYEFCKQIQQLTIPVNAELFSLDAVSMYTNIDTKHALEVINTYLLKNKPKGINIIALIDALRIVMNHNVFKFGDTHWVQQCGTAMGAPPAPNYATLYYCIHEEQNIPLHPNISYYGRYIDDGFGLWIPSKDPAEDVEAWKQFQSSVSFGKLQWEFTKRSTKLDFLDLTIKITNNKITTSLYEKAVNLYLYLPPHSCHPPGAIRGLVNGRFIRIKRLTSNKEDVYPAIKKFYDRLKARGYSSTTLLPLFNEAWKKDHSKKVIKQEQQDPVCFIHLNYHPNNLSAKAIQSVYNNTIVCPKVDCLINEIKNHKGNCLEKMSLTVAYHRYQNIGNLLSPRKMDSANLLVSNHLPK